MSAGGREQGDVDVSCLTVNGDDGSAAVAGSLSIVGQVPNPRVLPIVKFLLALPQILPQHTL